DGSHLEHDLLNKMPRLSSFDLIVDYTSRNSKPINIRTFQTDTWEKFNSIVCLHDANTGLNTIYTLPSKSNQVNILSNEYVSSCISNRPVSLCFECVRSLALSAKTTLFTTETLEFVQQAFPNVKTLELVDNGDNVSFLDPCKFPTRYAPVSVYRIPKIPTPKIPIPKIPNFGIY
ncbi:unnamed protein product, partial [Didymodactylos carnosus]